MFLFCSIHAFLLTVISTGHTNTTNQRQRIGIIHRLTSRNDKEPRAENESIDRQTKKLAILLNDYTKQSLKITKNINKWLCLIRSNKKVEMVKEEKQVNIASLIKNNLSTNTIKQAQVSLKQLVEHGYSSLPDSALNDNSDVYFNVRDIQELINLASTSYTAISLALGSLFCNYNHLKSANQIRSSISEHLTNMHRYIEQQFGKQEVSIEFDDYNIRNLKLALMNFCKLLDGLMLESDMIDHLIRLIMNDNATNNQFYECFRSSIKASNDMNAIPNEKKMLVHISIE